MKINISGLSEGSYRYDLVTSAAELGLEPNFIGNVTANITLEKSIHQIVAMVNASVKGVFICDRCANEFTDDVKASFTTVFSWEQTEETEEDDDFHVLRGDENIIDLTSAVKEYLILSIPVKVLCQNNCEIPSSVSAHEETIDPRWEKLKILKQTEKN